MVVGGASQECADVSDVVADLEADVSSEEVIGDTEIRGRKDDMPKLSRANSLITQDARGTLIHSLGCSRAVVAGSLYDQAVSVVESPSRTTRTPELGSTARSTSNSTRRGGRRPERCPDAIEVIGTVHTDDQLDQSSGRRRLQEQLTASFGCRECRRVGALETKGLVVLRHRFGIWHPDGDGAKLVQCHGYRLSILASLSTKAWVSAPIPSIQLVSTSPSCKYCGGVRPIPTPDGVPVKMMSPGKSVTIFERYPISSETEKIMSRVRPSCLTSPLSSHPSLRSSGCSSSSTVTTLGPIGAKPMCDLARLN